MIASGLDELVRAADPDLAAEMEASLQATADAVLAIPAPFDEALKSQGSPGWMRANEAVDALFDQADLLVDVGLALGLENVAVDLPE